MTADWFDLPGDVLKTISNHLIKEVKGINRAVYDINLEATGNDCVGGRD